MTAQAGHLDDRQVIPRWRSFAATVRIGELRPLSRAPSNLDDDELKRAFVRERLRPSKYAAAQLLSILLARGEQGQARAVASRLEGPLPLTLAQTAARLLKSGGSTEDVSSQARINDTEFDPKAFSQNLGADARRRIRARGNASAAWADLALAHTVQGLTDRAQKEMRHALNLAPDSRFVLRAAARLYVHLDDVEKANWILNSSERVLEDPWLMAAELSTSELAFGRTKNVRRARSLAEAGHFTDLALSELRSELATAEIRAGRDRKARMLFQRSFVDPTENAVAQAVSWAERSRLELDPGLLRMEDGHEARALEGARNGEWQAAITESAAWHRDQPFSVEPIQFASYAASVGAGDYERAAQIAAAGLALHRDDRTLRNNAAYALANLGRTAEARAQIVPPKGRESVEDLTEVATTGLISFREGDIQAGRVRYREAVAGFERIRRQDLAATATVHLVLEEARLGLGTTHSFVSRVRRAFPLIPLAEREAFTLRVSHVLRDLERAPSPSRSIGGDDGNDAATRAE